MFFDKLKKKIKKIFLAIQTVIYYPLFVICSILSKTKVGYINLRNNLFRPNPTIDKFVKQFLGESEIPGSPQDIPQQQLALLFCIQSAILTTFIHFYLLYYYDFEDLIPTGLFILLYLNFLINCYIINYVVQSKFLKIIIVIIALLISLLALGVYTGFVVDQLYNSGFNQINEQSQITLTILEILITLIIGFLGVYNIKFIKKYLINPTYLYHIVQLLPTQNLIIYVAAWACIIQYTPYDIFIIHLELLTQILLQGAGLFIFLAFEIFIKQIYQTIKQIILNIKFPINIIVGLYFLLITIICITILIYILYLGDIILTEPALQAYLILKRLITPKVLQENVQIFQFLFFAFPLRIGIFICQLERRPILALVLLFGLVVGFLL